jgi:hypothetical protein
MKDSMDVCYAFRYFVLMAFYFTDAQAEAGSGYSLSETEDAYILLSNISEIR